MFTLKNGVKLVYLVKFIGIDNYYGLEPLIVDKARHPTNMIDFFMTNQMDETFDFTLSDLKSRFKCSDLVVKRESSPVELYHAQYKLGMSESDNIMDRNTNNPHWYEKVGSKFDCVVLSLKDQDWQEIKKTYFQGEWSLMLTPLDEH